MSKVDTTLWGKFMIGQLFDIYKPNVYHQWFGKKTASIKVYLTC